MLPEPLISGLIMFQVLFCLVQWYFFRRAEYLYYVGYAIAVGVYFLLKYNSVPDEIVHVGKFSFNELLIDKSIMFIAFCCYIEFAKLFLVNTSTATRLYKVVTIVTRCMLIYALLSFIYVAITRDFANSIKIHFFISVVLYILFMGVLFMVIKNKLTLGKFLVAGSLMMALGALLSVIFGFSKPYQGIGNRDVIVFFQLGVIIELIILNTGLLYKTKLYAINPSLLSLAVPKDKEVEDQKLSSILQTMRKEIFYELQTELGDGLSGIKLMSEMMKQRMGENYSKELERISENSDNLVQSMNEIVWSLNRTHDDLPGLLAYIRSYAVRFLEQVNIDCEITTPQFVENLSVSGEVRRHIFLLVKEALHNVVKHADAKKATILFEIDSRFQIVIFDDGVGISGNALQFSSGSGLHNMRKRIELLKGEMNISNHEGTTVHFNIPVSVF